MEAQNLNLEMEIKRNENPYECFDFTFDLGSYVPSVPILVNLGLLLVGLLVLSILKLLCIAMSTWFYHLDMTVKEYCKPLAEMDNSLKNQPEPNNTTLYSTGARNSTLDCDGELPAGLATNNNRSHLASRKPVTSEGGSLFLGSVNHNYPNGWIPLVESRKVEPGAIKRAIIMGKDVIVTRSSDGQKVNVLDAYCPHMGAHLGIASRVVNINQESCVECPFHGWTFRASDGKCVKIPYQKDKSKGSIPIQAKLNSWIVDEVDNFIYVWHHNDNLAPNWMLEPTLEIQRPNWHLACRSCHHTNLDLQDMHANGADMSHFESIHNDLLVFGGDITKILPLRHLQSYFRHHWLPSWEPILKEDGRVSHKALMKVISWTSFFKLNLFEVTVHAFQIGPARVDLYYDSKFYGRGILVMNSIPLGGRRVKYIQHMYSQRSLLHTIRAKLVFYGEVKQLERDFWIWNHKRTIRNPIFIPEDKTLKQFRMWYSQFYKRRRSIVISHDDESELTETTTNGQNELCKRNLDF